MEFKLNKIDTDLRQRINEERSEDKVHNKKRVSINKDKNKDEGNRFLEENNKESSLRKDIEKGNQERPEIEEPDKGHFIDIRR